MLCVCLRTVTTKSDPPSKVHILNLFNVSSHPLQYHKIYFFNLSSLKSLGRVALPYTLCGRLARMDDCPTVDVSSWPISAHYRQIKKFSSLPNSDISCFLFFRSVSMCYIMITLLSIIFIVS